jgi:propionyl-CoA carboxylase beta chain
MASKEIGADMNYAWPTAQIAVMGAKGAVEIIFRADIGDAEKIAARTKEYEDRFLSPFIAAERGYIDDVIMPHSTRKRIARALAMLKDKKVETPAKKHDNLPLWRGCVGGVSEAYPTGRNRPQRLRLGWVYAALTHPTIVEAP